MNQNIKILFVEDLPTDVELAQREIKKENISFVSRVVDTEEQFRKELDEFNPDIIISDYSMPNFDGMRALKITRSLNKYIPFIVLTGSVNEEIAVECMKTGASDYVLKEKIKRLPFAVLEALEKHKARLENEKMENQVRESELKYRTLIENSADAIYLLYNRKFEIINPSFKKMFGYSIDEVNRSGFDFLQLVAPESKNRIEERFKKMQQGKYVDPRYEFTALTKTGEKKEVEASVSYLDFKGKKATQGVIRDISERKAAERKLRLLGRAVHQNPVAIVITDSGGMIEYINPVFEKITGYSADETIGKNPRILNSGYHSKEFYKNLWETILSGQDWEGEFKNQKKNGELYWEDAIISPILNSQKKITHFVAVKEDITEKKKMLEDLIIAKDKAEESDRLKSAFLANMSHEIRTPMNGILGFSELLKEPNLTGEEQQQYISVIERSGARMLNIINDIIDISKIESGLMKLDIKETNINEQIEYIYTFFKPEVEAKGMKFSFNTPLSAKEATIATDSEKVYAILTNLVKNAIKYSHKGSIEIGYKIVEIHRPAPNAFGGRAALQFYIKDTGIGIPIDRQEAIFERFIQADIANKMAHQGAGLGLSITRAYIELLGGKIWVESEEGKGSIFYFSLPYNAVLAKETTFPQTDTSDKKDNIKKLKILIAEDDEVSEMLLDQMIKMYGKEVLKARTGNEAVESCKNNPDIDLVLMDIRMPEMNGYEAIKQIRDFNKKVVIIAQTAYGLTGDREKAIKAGCNDYLSKPINKDKLQSLMHKYFAK